MNAIPMQDSFSSDFHWRKSNSGTRPILREAFSSAGRSTKNAWNIIQERNIRSVTCAPGYVKIQREANDILDECSQPDWDGYDAKPIDMNSVHNVLRFIKTLPNEISYPELCPEPNGDLTMVWRKNGYYIVIGIDGSGKIEWGGSTPNGHIYGDLMFGVRFPDELLNLLISIEKSNHG